MNKDENSRQTTLAQGPTHWSLIEKEDGARLAACFCCRPDSVPAMPLVSEVDDHPRARGIGCQPQHDGTGDGLPG